MADAAEVAHATDAEVFAALPAVLIDRDNVEHYRGLLARRLLINRCAACGYWVYPHRPLCPKCWSWDVVPTQVSGDGFVFLCTLVHQERDPDAAPGEPVSTAAVELVEQPGLRYLAPVVNCPPDRVRLDMPVRLTWVDRDGVAWPAFQPSGPIEGGR
ncbi:zinc ribbon domain-containing protein [Pseudofrankia sp. BMG5.37]|uniref:Zn-ribbon domain-containing OB-fold protein n=1 Tax=Pseudofrankia sp. BMG5.37 TaxID=3050035 RepID=UPI00289425D2|nr:zinc ribbon domain-containing protein [Pseudofrankia sp. BMG5.37]MDT3440154.1 OB-fold domain-containing protein [Pseudofrankia sp. BMG5.37]